MYTAPSPTAHIIRHPRTVAAWTRFRWAAATVCLPAAREPSVAPSRWSNLKWYPLNWGLQVCNPVFWTMAWPQKRSCHCSVSRLDCVCFSHDCKPDSQRWLVGCDELGRVETHTVQGPVLWLVWATHRNSWAEYRSIETGKWERRTGLIVVTVNVWDIKPQTVPIPVLFWHVQWP